MRLETQGLQSLEQVRTFLEDAQPLEFETPQRTVAYEFIVQQLRHYGFLANRARRVKLARLGECLNRPAPAADCC